MPSELAGLGGYASLMKTQKNPYERNLATTQAVLGQMSRDGGVTGWEGLGKIPLMYQMGVDSANAKQFDSDQATKEQEYMTGVQSYQRAQDAAKLKLEQDKANADMKYKYAQSLQQTLLTATALSKSGNEGEAVKLLNENGIPATSFTADEHGPMAGMTNGVFWRMNKTGATVWDGEQRAWRPATESDVTALQKPAKLTGHVVRDPASKTGYSYAGDDGRIMTPNAPTPTELHPRQGGDSDTKADLAFYKQKSAEVRRLQQLADAGYKGQIIIDGVAHSIDGSAESQAALRNLAESRKAELTGNPTYAPLVQKHDPQWLAPKPNIVGDPNKYMPLSAAPKQQAAQPQSESKVINGVTYIKRNGQWYQR